MAPPMSLVPWRRSAQARAGHVLLTVLMVISTIAIVIMTVGLLQSYQAQLTRAIAANRRLQPALESAMRTLQDGTVGLAARRMGRLSATDVDTLEALVATLTLPAPLVVDSAVITFETPRVGVPMPPGVSPLWSTTDYPRASWTQGVPLAGMRADTLTPVRIRLAIRGEGIGRAAAEIVIGVAQVAADQFAIQTDGPLELCTPSDSALPSRTLVTSGTLLATGVFRSACDGVWYHHGPFFGTDSLVHSGTGVDTVMTEGGLFAWAPSGLAATDFWGGYTAQHDAFLGHAAVLNAVGGTALDAFRSTATRAGYGECDDDTAACGGAGVFAPALTIQRMNANVGTAVTVSCGAAMPPATCTAHQVSDAWGYYERPPAPVDGEWQGLFPDPRREDRCTWSSPRGDVRTFRCGTNSYGHVIRVGEALGPDGADAGTDPDTIAAGLPAIPGGVVFIRGSEANAGLPGNFQEVVVLRNAERLNGPLHIVSRLPVFIEGSFNVTAPTYAAAITAPMITVLPEQTPVQAGYAMARDAAWALYRDSTATPRGWSMVWDSLTGLLNTDPIRLDVPGSLTPQRITAYTPIVINAVLRSTYEPTVAGIYRGGVVEQIPAVLGDFASVSLVVNGSIYGRPAGGAWSGTFEEFGDEFSGMVSIQPKARYVIQQPQNTIWGSTPPGSWNSSLFVGGSPSASRPQVRQALAQGGSSVVFMLSPLRRLPRGRL